ncbi:MAG TPA: nuclear transport factor 2 family protein [Acidimicrobiales bacterium]|nr:nuclear transport factor 2 family protein [Acidimicrobiales bacterium]
MSPPHDAVRGLIQRYARAVDQRDIDGLVELFHPDAEIAGAGGVQSLEEWLDTMRAPRAFPSSMHMIGEPLITGEAEAEEVAVDTYAVVYQLGHEGSGDLTLGIRYLDDVVLYRGRWLFRRRTSHTLWMR